MQLTSIQIFITILAVALGAICSRFLPFLLFPDKKKTPKIIEDLGSVLPPAMMGLLVVYCLKDLTFISAENWICELVAIMAIVLLHKWKGNVLLSIGTGTLIYMVMAQVIF